MAVIFLVSAAFIENSYPNEQKASHVLDSVVEPGNTILVEGSAFRYYTKKIAFGNIATNFWFDYNGDEASDEIDYKNAINSGVFIRKTRHCPGGRKSR